MNCTMLNNPIEIVQSLSKGFMFACPFHVSKCKREGSCSRAITMLEFKTQLTVLLV